MINLDDTQQLLASQGGDAVLVSVHKFADQIQSAFSDVARLVFPQAYSDVSNVVFCGMGGSRFPGLILYHLYRNSFTIPFELCDDYILPGSITNKTLVILSSYSGTTEEVLFCANEAHRLGALVTGFSAGGALGAWLQEHNYPHYTFNQDLNPSKQPRMGFGYALGSFLGILVRLGLLRDLTLDKQTKILETEVEILRKVGSRYDVEIPLVNNPAKKMATMLQDRYPYFVLAEHLIGVGNCIQNQVNETSKNISSFRVIPELNHHLMEGLQFPTSHKRMALFVTICSELYTERVKRRFNITEDVIKQNNIEVCRHELTSQTKLGQVLELSVFGSYVTMYLAGLYGVDPAKIPYVTFFKEQLAK